MGIDRAVQGIVSGSEEGSLMKLLFHDPVGSNPGSHPTAGSNPETSPFVGSDRKRAKLAGSDSGEGGDEGSR
jgi:hypothetical protein